jgi:4-hydroxybenzoate polyprenyltransferase
MPAGAVASLAAPPLCVDLDGTLVCTDTLHEQLLLLLRQSPLALFSVIWVLFHSIAAFRRAVAARVELRPDVLPYNQSFVTYLNKQASLGRRILLVTAADQSVAERVSQHLQIFEAAIGSDGITNLKSEAKVPAIQQYLNGDPFEYAGDSAADVPVWNASCGALLINSQARVRRTVNRLGVPVTAEFRSMRPGLWTILRCMRVYQWTKNILVFVPLLLAHKLLQAGLLVEAFTAFGALSLAASLVYVVNDLLDLESDRKHPHKRLRPLAAGVLSIRQGVLLAFFLTIAAALISTLLPPRAQLLIGLYVAVSTLYSTILKHMLFLDVMVLASLYALRILYGGASTQIPISPSTLAFSIFLFISLAICKRLTELRSTGAATDSPLPGRAYTQNDFQVMTSLGSASAYAAVLVLALYISSSDVFSLYRRPQLLWGLCPLLAYWLSRILVIANRGNMDSDPILFAFRDRASYAVAASVLLIIILAI